MDRAVADMLPCPNDPAPGARAGEAVRAFASAVGQLEKYLLQLQDLKPTTRGMADAQAGRERLGVCFERDIAELTAELHDKDQLISRAREQIARWQEVISQQEQLQESTMFAGLGS
ncbi:hypothetical protein GPECTOR_1g210 [Gonium pectorale]|uniref:Uncharacterized protein n=1 Tax=Gonium pectorale TaxID=33097 RepID=A0A150H2N0_GONPE|nr:hypothetical protein GPECTOR_1g210 [Gonium pectorale]|eukprot:KXZ56242.1 hypothetical protein GPECTOR_1g210 [Gonium pectorale]